METILANISFKAPPSWAIWERSLIDIMNQSIHPFLEKYIFPDGMVPSVEQIDRARAGLFSLQDVQNLAAHYSPTLLAWHRNFQSNWGDISKHYDERFRRMFEFYLLYCAGGFRAGNLQHWQMVFAKQGQVIDYRGDR